MGPATLKCHFKVAAILFYLGRANRSLGFFDIAKATLEQALEIDEKHLGTDSVDASWTRLRLADVYLALSQPVKANQLIDHSIPILESRYNGGLVSSDNF